MNENTAICLLVFILVIAANLWLFWTASKSRKVIQRWAEEHGFQVVSLEERWLRRGPFFWTTSRAQTVSYITVIDSANQRRSGWIRCGSWLGGLWSSQVEVRWETEH